MAFPNQLRLNTSPSKKSFNRNSFSNFNQFDNLNNVKKNLLIQNKALAKKNSFLMTKITDLETKVSELIQQNVELRSANARNEDKKKAWFEQNLSLLEQGVSQRFEEIFQMFSTIRQNEKLSPPSITLNSSSSLGSSDVTQCMLLASSSSDKDKTVSFENVKSPNSKKERRRKSLRRQSIYIPSPGTPEKAKAESNFGNDLPNHENESHKNVESNEEVHIEKNNELNIEQQDEIPNSSPNNEEEISHATNLSPIKFTSPEELKSSFKNEKFKVFKDFEDEDESKLSNSISEKIQKLANEIIQPISEDFLTEKKQVKVKAKKVNNSKRSIRSTIINNDEVNDKLNDKVENNFLDTNKVKHTTSKRKKEKSSKDEQMPNSEEVSTSTPEMNDANNNGKASKAAKANTTAPNDTITTGGRRTRGRQINYAEPSLRMKMRRPSEKFSDAVLEPSYVKVEGNIFENMLDESKVMKHTNNKRKTISSFSGNNNNADINKKQADSSSSNSNKSADENSDEVNLESTLKKLEKDDEFIETINQSPTLINKRKSKESNGEPSNITKRRKPLSKLSENKQAQNSLKTNEKLITTNNSNEQLSAFDLVEELVIGVPKTYKGNPNISLKKKTGSSNTNGRRHSMMS